MIKIHLSDWLGKMKMTQKEASARTGIRPATIHAYYHETVKRIEVDHMEAFCKLFDCQPGDLFTHIKEEKPQ